MFFTKNKRERFVFIAWRIRDSDDDDNSKLNWLCVYFFFGLDLSFFCSSPLVVVLCFTNI